MGFNLGQAGKKLWDTLSQDVGGAVSGVQHFLGGIGHSVGDVVQGAEHWLGGEANQAGQAVNRASQWAGQQAQQAQQQTQQQIFAPLASAIQNQPSQLIQNLTKPVVNMASQNIARPIAGAMDYIAKTNEQFGRGMQQGAGQIANTVNQDVVKPIVNYANRPVVNPVPQGQSTAQTIGDSPVGGAFRGLGNLAGQVVGNTVAPLELTQKSIIGNTPLYGMYKGLYDNPLTRYPATALFPTAMLPFMQGAKNRDEYVGKQTGTEALAHEIDKSTGTQIEPGIKETLANPVSSATNVGLTLAGFGLAGPAAKIAQGAMGVGFGAPAAYNFATDTLPRVLGATPEGEQPLTASQKVQALTEGLGGTALSLGGLGQGFRGIRDTIHGGIPIRATSNPAGELRPTGTPLEPKNPNASEYRLRTNLVTNTGITDLVGNATDHPLVGATPIVNPHDAVAQWQQAHPTTELRPTVSIKPTIQGEASSVPIKTGIEGQKLTIQGQKAQALTDTMTGTKNLDAFNMARKQAEANPNTSLISFDANNFGRINKMVGKDAGDQGIKTVADSIHQAATEAGISKSNVYRVGGDEFAAIVPKAKAEAIAARAAEIHGVKDYGKGVRVSLTGTPGDTYALADSKLQAAKAEAKAAQGIAKPQVGLKLDVQKQVDAIPISKKEMDMGMGLSKEQLQRTKAEQQGIITPEEAKPAVNIRDNPKAAMAEYNAMGEKPKVQTKGTLSPVEMKAGQETVNKQTMGNPQNNPLYKKTVLPTVAEGDTTRAILNRDMVRKQTAVDYGKPYQEAVNKLTSADSKLFEKGDYQDRSLLLKKAERPQDLQAAFAAADNFNNYTHDMGYSNLEQIVPYRQNYTSPKLFENTKEGQVAQTHAEARLATEPGYSKARTLNYETGKELGLNRRFATVQEDVAYDIKRRSNDLSQMALAKGLDEAHPGKISVGADGLNNTQLRIPGAGNKLFTTQELADQINKRATANKSTKFGEKYDTGTRAAKTLAVGGNPFHGLTEAFRFIGQQVVSPTAWRHPLQTLAGHAKVVGGTFSERAANAAKASYEKGGTTQWSRIGGQTIDKGAIGGDVASKWYNKANKLNPVKAIHEAVFGREIPLQKLEIMKQAMKGSTDYTNPAMIAKAQQVANATNHMFGGLNRTIESFSPETAKWMSRGMFSADFTESKLRLWQDSLTKRGIQGNMARQAIIGKALVMAIPGVLALAATGKIDWNNPQDVATKVTQQILDPSLPTSFTTPSGIAKIARFSGSDIAELARVITPMFNGDPNKLSGLEHYAVSRVNPLLGVGMKLATNQDYKGDPIIAHKTDAQGNDLGIDPFGTAKNLAEGSLTSIGTNLAKVAEGKQSLAEAGVNMSGLRTGADPNDPKMQAMGFQANLIKSQSKQIQDDYSATHPQRTDKNGVVVQDRSFLDSAAKAAAMLDNPKLLELDQQIADKRKELGLEVDPFYNLNKDQQKVVLNLTNDRGFNAGDPVIERQTKDNPWLKQFYKERTAYYDSQNIKPDDKNPVNIAAPQADDATQALLDKMEGLDGAGRSQLIRDNPSVAQYLAEVTKYNRAKRDYLGKPQYDQFPTASAGVQKTLDYYQTLAKNTGARSAWIKANPQAYADMTNYLTQVSVYGLEKSIGQAAFESQGIDQKGLKDIANLAKYDISTSKDASGNTIYALGGENAGQSGGRSRVAFKSSSKSYAKTARSRFTFKGKTSIAKAKSPSVSSKAKVAGISKPKVSMKASLV